MNRGRLALVAAGALAVTLFFVFDLDRFLTLAALKAHHQTLVTLAREHALLTVAGFMAVYIVQTALSLPGAAVLSLAAGALFGTLRGTLYANIAATIGATLAFLVSRYLLREAVLRRFGSRLEPINRELEQRGFNYLLFLRLVPVFPFFLINLAAGLTRLPTRTFVLATMLGIVPGGVVYVHAGASLATVQTLADVASPRVLGAFALLGLFALVPALYGWYRNRQTGIDPGPHTH